MVLSESIISNHDSGLFWTDRYVTDVVFGTYSSNVWCYLRAQFQTMTVDCFELIDITDVVFDTAQICGVI